MNEMEKVTKMIQLLNEGNEEVKSFFQALSVDPEISCKKENGQITLNLPENFDMNFSEKIDDILRRNNAN